MFRYVFTMLHSLVVFVLLLTFTSVYLQMYFSLKIDGLFEKNFCKYGYFTSVICHLCEFTSLQMCIFVGVVSYGL